MCRAGGNSCPAEEMLEWPDRPRRRRVTVAGRFASSRWRCPRTEAPDARAAGRPVGGSCAVEVSEPALPNRKFGVLATAPAPFPCRRDATRRDQLPRLRHRAAAEPWPFCAIRRAITRNSRASRLQRSTTMKWNRGYRSNDVEVRRGGGGGGGGGLPLGLLSLITSKFGIGGGLIALLAFGAFQYFSGSLSGGGDQTAIDPGSSTAPSTDERVQFASFVLDDVQSTWTSKLPGYRRAKLVIFQNTTSTGCGYGERAIGPFYCPQDQHVYLDLDFFRTLEQKLGAGGDFAQAYVIAHEIGHHVQNQLGTSDKVSSASPRARQGAGGLSVKLELQADCFAGVWAHSTEQRNILETGDLEEALNAAASIGDDRLQRQARGTVQPESWTHGSSAQRVEWFRRGLKSGDPSDCDTFETAAR
jgi:uncharacterized protein